MTKILSVEERVTEFDEFLDKYTGKHEKNGLYATLFADCVKVRKEIIVKEFREALTAHRTTLLAAKDKEVRDKLLHDIEEANLVEKAAEKTGEPLYVYGFEDCIRRIKVLISPIK